MTITRQVDFSTRHPRLLREPGGGAWDGVAATGASFPAPAQTALLARRVHARSPRQLKWRPDSLDLLLELIEVHVVHCNNLQGGERIFRRIEAATNYLPAQKEEAKRKSAAWTRIYELNAQRRRYNFGKARIVWWPS